MTLDMNEWTKQLINEIPFQENMVDCGMFTNKFAE